MLRAQSATVSLAPNKRGQPPPWLTIIISVFVGYFLCWASQARHQPRRVVLTPRRTMAEDDGPIPHGPSRVPTGRCCCAGAGGVCFSELDFISMYRANSSHPERFALFSDLRQEAAWSSYPSFTELHQIIYRTEPNIYDNFQLPQGITSGLHGSHVNEATLDLFRSLLGRPAQLMIEVGSGTGNSAVVWGKELQKTNGLLVCFDTWAGDLAMWLSEAWREVMGWQDGHAHLWERFMHQIVQAELTGTVLPIKAASPVAARMMGVLNYTVDAVYLDSAQEGGELYLDMSLYWDLLAPGGLLMGDDYMWFWPGVIHDVDLFMKHEGLSTSALHFSKDWDYWKGGGVWAIQKPAEAAPLWSASR